MPSLKRITIAPALTFDALVAGEPGAPLVLLLHGFAESMNCWRAQATALADMGYRAIAPSQRGYSKDARPDPRDVPHYHIDRLMDDAMAIVASSGYGADRFHLAVLHLQRAVERVRMRPRQDCQRCNALRIAIGKRPGDAAAPVVAGEMKAVRVIA